MCEFFAKGNIIMSMVLKQMSFFIHYFLLVAFTNHPFTVGIV